MALKVTFDIRQAQREMDQFAQEIQCCLDFRCQNNRKSGTEREPTIL